MEILGRRDEIDALGERTAGPGPSLTVVSGPRRSGKTTVLRGALADVDAVWYQATHLPDPDHRALVVDRLRRHLVRTGHPKEEENPLHALGDSLGDVPDWPRIFQALADTLYVSQERTVMVLDGWHRLVDARSRIVRHFTEFWHEVRRRGIPLHMVLSTTGGSALAPFRDPEDSLFLWMDEEIALGPLPYREVTKLLPASRSPRERLTTYGVFGGWPEVIQHLDPGRTLGRNLKDAVLEPGAPLVEWGIDLLGRQVQAPGRYASILRALASGAREWGEIRSRVPDFTSSGQMAPYIQRLEEMGLITIERSLDASPRSRSRHYRIVDPFTVFWFRFVLPNLTELQTGQGTEVWKNAIQPYLSSHLAHVFPVICRTFLARYADERIPARAREVGGLWGSGYDLDVSGTLANGAVFYGVALWGPEHPRGEIADDMDRQVERTRYGFGREGRHRFVFTDQEPHASLSRRAARDHLVHVFGPRTLIG